MVGKTSNVVSAFIFASIDIIKFTGTFRIPKVTQGKDISK